MKICARCKKAKGKNCFCKDKSRKDGLNRYCKSCSAFLKKRWYTPHPRIKKVVTEKRCRKCLTVKNASEFHPRKGGGLASWCKQCLSIHRNKRNKDNPIQRRNQQYKAKHGITLDEYNRLLVAQNERCAICNKHISEFNIAFAIDHNHRTGCIRGLLCTNCNRGIGYLQDSQDILAKAIAYLKRERDGK